jgi:arylsulfatase A-like enzyme
MTVPRQLVLLGCMFLGACQGDTAEPAVDSAVPPNILLILVDDMGFNDLGANGAALSLTPRLDAFAARGVRFTRHYVDSTCSATRAGILTGQPPAALGFRPDALGLSPELLTLPEVLRDAGYSTHHVGKWHLGYASRLAWPTRQGFDSFFGFLNQFVLRGYDNPDQIRLKRPTYQNPFLQTDEELPVQFDGHLSEVLADRVIAFLRDARDRDRPWFLNYWTFLPHAPLQPAGAYASRFPDTPTGRYRAMLTQLDATVGRVLDALDENGLSDRTLVIIASDNGGTGKTGDSNAPFAGRKASFLEGGVRTPLLLRWPSGEGAGSVRDDRVSFLDYLPTLAAAAGADLPPGLPGRDIRRPVPGDEQLPPLFWLASDSRSIAWSVLSGNGRWRLHRYHYQEPILNDLQRRPAGDVDVSQGEPARVGMLFQAFLEWKAGARIVPLTFESDGERGQGRLSGMALQRAPGFGEFSFAIGIRPAAHSNDGEQVIAVQPGYWRLSQRGQQLQLDVLGNRLTAALPAVKDCAAVVVSMDYRRNPFAPGQSYAEIDLFIDGTVVASKREQNPALAPDRYQRPTWIGQAGNGRYRFQGDLGMPRVLSERVLVEQDAWSGNGVASISGDLCRGV